MANTRLGQDEWRRVEEVYHEALEHRPESRAASVTAACGGDSSLRREVEWLLAPDGAHALVDQPAMDIIAKLLDDGAPLAPGTELGPYRIEKLIGGEGICRVYQARDSRLNRTVAIKISKEEFGERFEREARAVAAVTLASVSFIVFAIRLRPVRAEETARWQELNTALLLARGPSLDGSRCANPAVGGPRGQ